MELSYEISLLTPMFGDGVEAGEPDTRMPFRATAVRGQLQFWWRATVGANCGHVEELRKKHAAVWGDTDKASKVKVIVGKANATLEGYLIPAGWPKYALFPFAGEQVERISPGGSFALRIVCPKELQADVQIALRAWVNFGGMGARTRRGCGSIYCKELAPANLAEAAALVKKLLPNPPEGAREWPTLGGPLLVGNESDALRAWSSAVGALQKFRQGEGFARNIGVPDAHGNRHARRSRWPEPETIRSITGRRMGRHQRMGGIPEDAFPRAELGLPIIFHFNGDQGGDPHDTTLYPLVGGEKCERMASPLIIKAMGLSNGGAVPIILRLRTPQLGSVRLEGAGEPMQYGPGQLRGARLAEYEKSPMAGTPSGSALDAFINFIQDEDVWGVLR